MLSLTMFFRPYTRAALWFLALSLSMFSAPVQAPDQMDVFLLIGQSNMAGRGVPTPADRVPHPRVFMLNKDLAWMPAVDPMHFDKPELIGVGLGSTFGRLIADARPNATIGLVPAAFGGSALEEWQPGQKHYVNAVARAREAMKRGRLVGILWHQGESDADTAKTATYAARFAKFIAQLRQDLGAPDVPVIVGELGRFRPEHAGMNAVLATLPKSVPHCAFVSAEGLVDKGDKLHFDTPSLHEFGRRYATAWLAMQK